MFKLLPISSGSLFTFRHKGGTTPSVCDNLWASCFVSQLQETKLRSDKILKSHMISSCFVDKKLKVSGCYKALLKYVGLTELKGRANDNIWCWGTAWIIVQPHHTLTIAVGCFQCSISGGLLLPQLYVDSILTLDNHSPDLRTFKTQTEQWTGVTVNQSHALCRANMYQNSCHFSIAQCPGSLFTFLSKVMNLKERLTVLIFRCAHEITLFVDGDELKTQVSGLCMQ